MAGGIKRKQDFIKARINVDKLLDSGSKHLTDRIANSSVCSSHGDFRQLRVIVESQNFEFVFNSTKADAKQQA
jgi:hypothetical protein